MGFGAVRIIWRPGAPVAIGKSLSYPDRSVDIDLLDDPERLADWLRKQVRARKGGRDGA